MFPFAVQQKPSFPCCPAEVSPVFPSAVQQKVILFTANSGFAAWNGLTSSGVEQSFSKLQRHVTPERDHMLLETMLDEAMLQLNQDLFSDLEVTQKAQKVWLKYFNPPRTRKESRIDSGCTRSAKVDSNSEVAWKRQRNETINKALEDKPKATLEEVQGAARELSSHLLSETVLREQAFQKDKQHKNKLVAYLDNCLLEGEVDGEFIETAQAFKDAQDLADNQKVAEKKRKWSALNPKQMCDPMTRKVFVAQPEFLDDIAQAELQGCRVADPEHSDFIAEADPASPQDIIINLKRAKMFDCKHIYWFPWPCSRTYPTGVRSCWVCAFAIWTSYSPAARQVLHFLSLQLWHPREASTLVLASVNNGQISLKLWSLPSQLFRASGKRSWPWRCLQNNQPGQHKRRNLTLNLYCIFLFIHLSMFIRLIKGLYHVALVVAYLEGSSCQSLASSHAQKPSPSRRRMFLAEHPLSNPLGK